jgi:hypothetical protein
MPVIICIFVGLNCGVTIGGLVLIAVIICIYVGLICGVTVGGAVLIAVIISIFYRSYVWCYSRWFRFECCNH